MIEIISDEEVIFLLKLKYPYENQTCGDEENKKKLTSREWIQLFDSLHKLKMMCKNDEVMNEYGYPPITEVAVVIRELSAFNHHFEQDVFLQNYQVIFELLNIYSLSLGTFYGQNSKGNELSYFQIFSKYEENGEEVPVKICLSFYLNFKSHLTLNTQQSNLVVANQKPLMDAQQKIIELYRRYAGLYVFNIAYQLDFNPEMTLKEEIIHQFKELLLVEQQIVSDSGLLKVFFNLEDNGLHGCLLNCILIYPLQLYKNANKTLTQLKRLAENSSEDTHIKFINTGLMFKDVCGEDVVGRVDCDHKLEKFLYWSLGAFYRYEDFFHYHYPSIFHLEIHHEQVLEPWISSLRPVQTGFKHRIVNIDQSEWINIISEPEDVWSISTLDKVLQKKLMVDQLILSEISYELNYVKNLNGEILYFIEIFDTYLKDSKEPFFYFNKFKDVIVGMQPSQLGQQLIYLINLFSQQPDFLNEIRTLAFILKRRLSSLLESMLWVQIEVLANRGSNVLGSVETLKNLNKLRGSYRPDQLSAKLSSFQPIFSEYTKEDLVLFHRRNRDAVKYVEELLKEDLLICRLKFYADIEGKSFLDQKEVFSKHFTEFIRVQKRTDLLKVLKGYFLVWVVEFPLSWLEIEQMKKPYVDIIFMIESNYNFDVQEFLQELHTKWRDYLGKISATPEVDATFKTRDLVCDIVMHSDELLNLNFIHFEKKNRKLKKTLLEKLVPYFTYRHFYYPKLYDYQIHKKVKMFSKGQ